MTDIEEKAKSSWNSGADEYNQWSALGQDEKDELIAAERARSDFNGFTLSLTMSRL